MSQLTSKEIYLYSDEIDEDLFHAIEKQLGCNEASLSLLDRTEEERAKDFGCVAYTSQGCDTPKDNIFSLLINTSNSISSPDPELLPTVISTIA